MARDMSWKQKYIPFYAGGQAMTKENNEKILAAYRIAVENGCQDISQLLFEVIIDAMNGGRTQAHYKDGYHKSMPILYGRPVYVPDTSRTPPDYNDSVTMMKWTVE